MSTEDRLVCLHRNLLLTGLAAWSTSSIGLATWAVQRPTLHRAVPFILMLTTFALLILGLSLWNNEKQRQGTDMAAAVHQIRVQHNLPKFHEAALLASAGAILALVGVIGVAYQIHHQKNMGWAYPLALATGWILLSFGCSCSHHALSTMEPHRLAWTLVGAAAIVASWLALPAEQESGRFKTVGLVGPAHHLGWILFLVGYAHASTFEP